MNEFARCDLGLIRRGVVLNDLGTPVMMVENKGSPIGAVLVSLGSNIIRMSW